MEPTRLNLGAGDKPLDGYINLDRKTGQECFPLAYDDGSVDVIRASHILEHFPHAMIEMCYAIGSPNLRGRRAQDCGS